MGGLDSPEESYGRKKHASKEESFKGCYPKCSVGTMDEARSNVCNSVTRPFAVQIGKQCGLAMKKLVEKGEETDYDEPSYPKKKKEGDGHEEAVAKWKINMSEYADKTKEHNNEKEKAFSTVLGTRCDETVISRLENTKEYEVAE